MNKKKVIGIIFLLCFVAASLVGSAAADGYQVTATADNNGQVVSSHGLPITVDCAYTLTFADNGNVVLFDNYIIPVANNGYKFDYWTINGVLVESETYPYVTPSLSQNTVLVVHFAEEHPSQSIVNVFWYQNDLVDAGLVAGYTYVSKDGYAFTVPTTGDLILTEENAPAGVYYHYTGSGASEYNQIVNVSAPALIQSKISEKTIYRDDVPQESTITIANTAGVNMGLVFIKEDESVIRSVIPGTTVTTVTENNVFTIEATSTAEKGNWDIYAAFKIGTTAGTLNKDANDYAYVKIDTLKIQQDREDGESELISSAEMTCKDGSVLEVIITGPKYDGYRGIVTVKYYAGDETPTDAKVMTTSTANLSFLEGQEQLNEEGTAFTIPNIGSLIFGIQAATNTSSDKVYNLEIYVTGCGDENAGGTENPLTTKVTVIGCKFTSALSSKSYVKGTTVTMTGAYEKEDFKAYVYIEGTNTYLFAPAYATKNTSSGARIDTEYKDGKYTLKFSGYNFRDLNAGTYTVYVSPYKIRESDVYVRDFVSETGMHTYQYNVNDEGTCVTKAEMLKEAKVLTLILTEPQINITGADKEIEAGINNYKGKFLTVDVSAEGANDISLYIIGQHKVFYINGDEAEEAGFVKNLDKNDTEHYLFSANGNKYYYNYSATGTAHDLAEEKSVTKVAEKLGLNSTLINASYVDEFGVDGYMPLYLIIDNRDGTFSIYIHMQVAGEVDDRGVFGPVETYNNTVLALGQYYIVVQHPMADAVFNVWAGVIVPYAPGNNAVYNYINALGFSEDTYPTNLYYGYAWQFPTTGTKYYAINYDANTAKWTAVESPYTTQANIFSTSAFEFNIPSVKNLDAATKLTNLIADKGDASDGADFYVVAQADEVQVIKAPEASYNQGEVISILVSGTNWDYITGTLEANEFDFDAPNINYIQSFAVTIKEINGKTTYTLTLDTTDVPKGDYIIVLRADDTNEVKKVYEVKIIGTSEEPKVEVTVSISGASALKVGDTTLLTAKNSDGSYAKFAWTSSDASIASVDENGNVKALKEGQVTITATNTETGKTATKTITVAKAAEPTPETPELSYPETLQLRAGWNFISVPMKLDSSMDTASEFFSEVNLDGRSVFGYDSSAKQWIQLSSSTVLKPLDGYWVYSKTDFTGTKKIKFDTKSMTLGNTKNIYKGWNAVGLNIDVTDGTYYLSAKSTFAGLDWNRYFENYTTGSWKVIVNGGSSADNEENYIYAGAGGWIYANEDGILVGNAS